MKILNFGCDVSTNLVTVNPFSVPEPSTDCCGQRIPIRVIALLVGVLELFALVVSCVVVGIAYSRMPTDDHILYTYGTPLAFPEASLGLSIAALVCGSVLITVMFWGLHTERAVLLVPHIMGQVAAAVGLLTLIAFLSIYTAVTHYEVREQAATMILINLVVITLCIFALILTGWFFVYSLATYRYLKVREQYRKEQTTLRRVTYDNRLEDDKMATTRIGHLDAVMIKNEVYGAI